MRAFRSCMLLAMTLAALQPRIALAQRSGAVDVVLVGGRVIDPETNLDAVRTVAIMDGRIVSVGTAVPAARDTVNVQGLVVAPGFIDLHSHGQDSINYQYLAHDGVTTALELEIGTYPVAPWYAKREGKSLINYGASASHVGARRAMLDHDSTAEGADVLAASGAFVRSPIAHDHLGRIGAAARCRAERWRSRNRDGHQLHACGHARRGHANLRRSGASSRDGVRACSVARADREYGWHRLRSGGDFGCRRYGSIAARGSRDEHGARRDSGVARP